MPSISNLALAGLLAAGQGASASLVGAIQLEKFIKQGKFCGSVPGGRGVRICVFADLHFAVTQRPPLLSRLSSTTSAPTESRFLVLDAVL